MCLHSHLWRPRRGRHGVLLAFALTLAGPGAVRAQADAQILELPDAVAQALAQSPSLQVFVPRLSALDGKRFTAGQAPAYELGLQVEDALGSGTLSGVDGAEYTLSLSSVIELGNKRDARVQAATGRYALVEAERRAQALDLLGAVTRGFIAALALQERLALAAEALELAASAHVIVRERADRGAAPQAEVLRARAHETQSRLEQDRLRAAHASSLMALANLLGRESAGFARVHGDLYAFTTPGPFPDLFERALESPGIRVFASEERLREAELALVRSQSRSDVRWQLGARYAERPGDAALVAGVSAPLRSGVRNRGEVQAALAARDEVGWQRERALLALRSRLHEAYRLHQHGVTTVDTLQQEVLPDLREALELTRAAYEQGRYGFVEWQTAQRELLSARQDLVDAATSALLNQALIEQLTAQPLSIADGGSVQ